MVEGSDLLFAIDSIPAVIAVTRDPFLAYSSNAFAILGLRSLYFVIAPLIVRFRYLKQSLIFLLAFVGVKMLLAHHAPIPTAASLGIILGILGVGIVASIVAAGGSADPQPNRPEVEKPGVTGVPGRRPSAGSNAAEERCGIGQLGLRKPVSATTEIGFPRIGVGNLLTALAK